VDRAGVEANDNSPFPLTSGNLATANATDRHALLHTLLLRSGIALGLMLLISVWLGWIVAGRVLAPLRVITARTHEISEDNLHERLALPGPKDEIKDLGDTIDGLLARLEGAFDAQRRFVGDASHELRTPLAMMRTSLDVAAGKPRPMSQDAVVLSEKIREGLDQADRLVESFLVLASAHAGGLGELETVSLAELAGAALGDRMEEVRAQALTVHPRLADASVLGSPVLLQRLVANLLDNAVRHNRPGGSIAITTEVGGSLARLTVDNDGPCIDPEAAARLDEPFRRAGADHTGSEDGVGLGLAIVAAIADAHHGAVALLARPQGGLTAIVELPCSYLPATGGAAV
jgi:signal transduction histidine kinase